MENDGFIVIEGIHENPNNINTLDEQTKVVHGPYNKIEAEKVAKGLIQKNIDNFYHRAWVINKNVELNNICEECKKKMKASNKILSCIVSKFVTAVI